MAKRKKKRHYKTGVYNSSKAKNPVKYRSGWELTTAIALDRDPTVLAYEYEPFYISYISSIKSRRYRKYFPDFVVRYVDGSTKIIEVKRLNQVTNLTVMKKTEAAKQWCEKRGILFELWTDKKIQMLEKLNAAQNLHSKPIV